MLFCFPRSRLLSIAVGAEAMAAVDNPLFAEDDFSAFAQDDDIQAPEPSGWHAEPTGPLQPPSPLLDAAQREKLAIRAAKREARERARLEAKAATFLPLAKTTTREATEKFMLRLGAGLESTIVGDLTIGRQLWDLREACLETGAIATNGPLCALVDAASVVTMCSP